MWDTEVSILLILLPSHIIVYNKWILLFCFNFFYYYLSYDIFLNFLHILIWIQLTAFKNIILSMI